MPSTLLCILFEGQRKAVQKVIEIVWTVYCKLPTKDKQLPAFPNEVTGQDLNSDLRKPLHWEPLH